MRKIILIYIFIIAFILNLAWEFSHYPLYNDLSGIPKNLHLFQASFFDALIILFTILIISLKNKNFNWIKKPKSYDYILFIMLSLVIAIIIEMINLNLGRWQYTSVMPTIFGLGLSPLAQLSVTGLLTVLIVRFFISIFDGF